MDYSFLASTAISVLFLIHGVYLIIILIKNKIDYSKSREHIQDAIKFRLNFLKYISINNVFRGIILFALICSIETEVLEKDILETKENLKILKFNWITLSLGALNKINDFNFLLGFVLLISMFYRLSRQNSTKFFTKLIHILIFFCQFIIAAIIIWQFLTIKISNVPEESNALEASNKMNNFANHNRNLNLQEKKQEKGYDENILQDKFKHAENLDNSELFLKRNKYNYFNSDNNDNNNNNYNNDKNDNYTSYKNELRNNFINNIDHMNSFEQYEFYKNQASFDEFYNSTLLNTINISLIIGILVGVVFTSIKLIHILKLLKEENNLHPISTQILSISICISVIFFLRLIYQIILAYGMINPGQFFQKTIEYFIFEFVPSIFLSNQLIMKQAVNNPSLYKEVKTSKKSKFKKNFTQEP